MSCPRRKSGWFLKTNIKTRRDHLTPGRYSKKLCRESGCSVSENVVLGVPDESTLVWHDGRRMVELGVLSEGLGECDSSECDKVLDLRNTVSETRSGLGCLLWVRCSCGELNRVPTGKSHIEREKGSPYMM